MLDSRYNTHTWDVSLSQCMAPPSGTLEPAKAWTTWALSRPEPIAQASSHSVLVTELLGPTLTCPPAPEPGGAPFAARDHSVSLLPSVSSFEPDVLRPYQTCMLQLSRFLGLSSFLDDCSANTMSLLHTIFVMILGGISTV